jgi:hypothetical protein
VVPWYNVVHTPVSRNVIIPTNNLLIRAVYKIKADSSGWPDLQVPRSGLVRVYCFYMFLRFDSHENWAGLVNLMGSRLSKARSRLSWPARQTRLANDNCVTTHALFYLESI